MQEFNLKIYFSLSLFKNSIPKIVNLNFRNVPIRVNVPIIQIYRSILSCCSKINEAKAIIINLKISILNHILFLEHKSFRQK